MRIGLIADIHGNAFALRAVLAELDRLGVGDVYCLGDIATPGPWPAEVIALLQEREIPCVRGNTDEWVLAAPDTPVSDSAEMSAQLTWAQDRLGQNDIAFLSDLPMHLNVDLGGIATTLFHATPRSATEVISAVTPPDDVEAMLAGVQSRITASGHTHVQMLRNTGTMTLINPGSVGLGGVGPGTPDLPRNLPVTGAEYAVLGVENGRSTVEFHHVDLDLHAMLRAAEATGMPYFEWWAALWRA